MDISSFSLDVALANLSGAFGSLEKLIVACSYVIGLALMVGGVLGFHKIATQTMSSAQQGEFAGPLIKIAIGAVLVYLPSTIGSSLGTVFGTDTVAPASQMIGYTSLTGVEKWQTISDVILKYMKLIGLIAFIRGWIILSKSTKSESQGGGLGKGLVHVIGGILLINLVDTVNILAQTFGYTG